jgi:ribosome biogenesis GTPase A
MNYNDIKVVDLPYNQTKIIKEVNDKKYFVFFLVDLFNINQEIIDTYHKIKNNKCLVISKSDVIPKSFNKDKIKLWLKNTYNINDNILFLSALKNKSVKNIFDILEKNNTKKCFIMGYTNSGKSTLINTLNNSESKINTSLIPNTTLDFINIYYEDYLFIDTPGFILDNPIYRKNELEFIKKINMKKFIKPVTYQMKKNESILIENKIRIENIGDNNSYTFYMSNDIDIKKVYENNDRLKEYMLKTYHIKNNTDIIIKGLGFINIKKECDINIYIENHNIIEFRNSFLGSD